MGVEPTATRFTAWSSTAELQPPKKSAHRRTRNALKTKKLNQKVECRLERIFWLRNSTPVEGFLRFSFRRVF